MWFGTNSSKKVNEYQNWYYPDGLLVVADYAGEMAEQLGDWLAKLAETGENRCPKRLRLILLERENLGDVPPFWYQTFTGSRGRRRVVEWFCADLSHPCIELPGLGDEALGALVQDYARSEKGRALSQTELSSVLEKAHEIDRDDHDDRNDHDDRAPRPLVTLFIADAVLEGNDYTHWDIPALVENIIERYQDHWRNTVCNGDEKLYNALEQVLVYATAVGGWDLNELPGPLKDASRTLLASGRVLEPLVCAVNEENTFRERLSPLEPDLVGEFYVLDYLNDLRYDKTTLAAWMQLFWEQGWEFAVFLDRCIRNYCNAKQFQALFRDGMAVFQPEEGDSTDVVPFAMLLANLTRLQPLKEGLSTVARLEALAERYPNSDELVLRYTQGMANFSRAQAPEDAKETVKTLRKLANQYPKFDEIAFSYASGLVNLSAEQSLEDRKGTVDKLEELTERFPDSAEIARSYTMGLVNLSMKQSLEDRKGTVDKLEELTERFSDSAEIARYYAVGLLNLAVEQSLEDRKGTVDKLEELTERFPDSAEIARYYAMGLFDLSCDQAQESQEDARETVNKLEALVGWNPQSDEIARYYAMGLTSFFAKQPPEDVKEVVDKLEALAGQYSKSDEIAVAYALGLCFLFIDQTPKEVAEAEKTVAKLGELINQHTDFDDDIVDLYTDAQDILAQSQPQE